MKGVIWPGLCKPIEPIVAVIASVVIVVLITQTPFSPPPPPPSFSLFLLNPFCCIGVMVCPWVP